MGFVEFMEFTQVVEFVGSTLFMRIVGLPKVRNQAGDLSGQIIDSLIEFVELLLRYVFLIQC